MGKCYSQYCPVAHALGLVGERWALLVVRDLLKGPKRYSDLLDSLPGIGTNILASRLRDLESGGVVRKTKLPPPAASTVYELTPYGRELEEVVHALARWGARSLGPPAPGTELAPGWSASAARALFDPHAAEGVVETYELRVDGDVSKLRVADGTLDAREGPAEDADATIETDAATLFALVGHELSPGEALVSGRVRVQGDEAALERFVAIFTFAARAPVSPLA